MMKKPNDSKMAEDVDLASSEIRKEEFRVAHPQMTRRSMEKIQAAFGRIMEEKQFATIDEANAFLGQFVGGRKTPDVLPRTLLEKAQDMMYAAWDEPSKKKRIILARRALEISGDCADAYVLLAEEAAGSISEAKDFFDLGVQAGTRALGPQYFQENRGHFWGILETRPYMRARAGLAECLWILGRREEAIAHFQDMIRLNPNDNQGLRFSLLNHLIEEGRDRDAKELIDCYPNDPTAAWLYSKALLKFKREGSNTKTENRLKKAIDANPFVPLFLLGMRKMPHRLPDMIGMGDENEAVEYVAGSISIWMKTPGALEWLDRVDSVYGGFVD